MKINVLVCDDEIEFLKIIKREIYNIETKIMDEVEAYFLQSGKKTLEFINDKNESIDILFLDIDMPNISGLKIAEEIRKKDNNMIIIFVSAHEQYVFESLEYNPYRYIRKNKIDEEFEKAFFDAYNKILDERTESIIIKTDDGEYRGKLSDIMYFEMSLRHINFYMKDGVERKFSGRVTIKELEKRLNSNDFIKIHSGCIVNVKYIREYSGHDITLDNGTKLIISRTRLAELKRVMSQYWRNKI